MFEYFPGKGYNIKNGREETQMAEELLIVLAAGIDQMLKTGIEHCREEFPRTVDGTGGKLKLYQNRNEGFPFGFLKEYPELVRALPAAVASLLGGMLILLKRRREKPAHRMALALILGGALSNILDRYVRGYVVDYFSIQAGGLKKVVMNLGDVCVFAGTAFLLILEFLYGAAGKTGRAVSAVKERFGEKHMPAAE